MPSLSFVVTKMTCCSCRKPDDDCDCTEVMCNCGGDPWCTLNTPEENVVRTPMCLPQVAHRDDPRPPARFLGTEVVCPLADAKKLLVRDLCRRADAFLGQFLENWLWSTSGYEVEAAQMDADELREFQAQMEQYVAQAGKLGQAYVAQRLEHVLAEVLSQQSLPQ